LVRLPCSTLDTLCHLRHIVDVTRFLCAVAAGVLLAPAAFSQEQAAAERPQFDVASVKLANGCQNNRNNQEPMPRPGRLQISCIAVQNLIQVAYSGIKNGRAPSLAQLKITGAPGWLQSDFYTIVAKTDAPTPVEVMVGPMLQALLEERFKLKLHRESREEPVYSMTVGKNGLKIQPTPEGSCTPVDLDHLPEQPAPGQPMPKFCGMQNMRFDKGLYKTELHGVTMKDLAQRLSNQLDRPVVDKTGVAGMFEITLEFAPDSMIRGFGGRGPGDAGRSEASPIPADPVGPTLFTAMQEQLGLKLAGDKAPVDYLVIDHVEKATEN
jgi:uncharacterized protein (TIGR03435 family)